MALTKKGDFPSLMSDTENNIWIVLPPVKGILGSVYYMLCMGKYEDGVVSDGKLGALQSVKEAGMIGFIHMPKGFFVEIEQV